MRSGIINGSSPMKDVLGILTGVWGTFRRGVDNEWLITKCPFFVHMEATLAAGQHLLPIVPNTTKALYWTSKDSYGSLIIKAGQRSFNIPVDAYVELTIFGETDAAP